MKLFDSTFEKLFILDPRRNVHTLQRNRFPKEKIEMRQQSHCVLETVSKPFTVFLSFWASLNTYLAVFLSVLYTSYPRIHISK